MKLSLSTSLSGFTKSAVPFVGALDGQAADMLDAFSAEYRLLSSYAGAAFNVRETTGSTAADIGFTPAGRFDATAFSSFIGAGSGAGVRWKNQVAGGTDYIQTGDATKQGMIELNQVNSGAVLHLDAVNDVYDYIRTLARPWTIYLVENPQGLGGGRRTLQTGTDINGLISLGRNDGFSVFLNNNISNAYVNMVPAIGTLSAPASSGASYYINGVDHTTSSGNTNEWGQLWLGAGPGKPDEPADTQVCELLVFSTAHDATRVLEITTILAGLRGISL